LTTCWVDWSIARERAREMFFFWEGARRDAMKMEERRGGEERERSFDAGQASRRRFFELRQFCSLAIKNLPYLVPGLVADDDEQGALPRRDAALDEGADLFVRIGESERERERLS